MFIFILFLLFAGLVWAFSSDWDKRELFRFSAFVIGFSAFCSFTLFSMSQNDFEFSKVTNQKVEKKDLIATIAKKSNIYATNKKDTILEIIKNVGENENLLGYTLVFQKLSFSKPSIVSGVEFEKEIFIKADPQKFAGLKELRLYTLETANNICKKFNLKPKHLKDSGNRFYLIYIPFFIFGILFIAKSSKIPPITILANQQRYFDEVSKDMVYKFYANRKDIKKDRVEILVNKEEKKLLKTFYATISNDEKDEKNQISSSFISTIFFLNLKNLKPTKINNTDEIKSPIYQAIFKKIKGYVASREETLDYNQELQNNDNFVEFFLMDLWERYTNDINISVANLEVLATNELELEFLGAIDTISINSVKPKGASLFYRYMYFKNRIKEYVNEQDKENNAEQQTEETAKTA
nr:hypothetical protein [Campylobacter sp.]